MKPWSAGETRFAEETAARCLRRIMGLLDLIFRITLHFQFVVAGIHDGFRELFIGAWRLRPFHNVGLYLVLPCLVAVQVSTGQGIGSHAI